MRKDRVESIWKIQNESSEVPIYTIEELRTIILENRGLDNDSAKEFINPKHPSEYSLEEVHIDPKEMMKSVLRIKKAIANNKKIVIVGDYDADGVFSSSILFNTLFWDLEHENTRLYIPHRFNDGYGLSRQIIEKLLADEKFADFSVMITVDNGIVANDAVDFANQMGIDVIITDHHTRDKILPEAYSIIHTTDTSGAAIAWYLSKELTGKANYLDLAVVGVVCDQMPLSGINRSIALHGLKEIRKTKNMGLLKIAEISGLKVEDIDVGDLGFKIGPRINAAGRLDEEDNALVAAGAICSRKPDDVAQRVTRLNQLNEARRGEEKDALQEISDKVEDLEKRHFIVYVCEQNEGIIGLIANKIQQQFYRPTLVLTKGEDGNLKGSARSTEGFDITKALRSIDDNLFEKLGGHEMAAGCSIHPDNLLFVSDALETYAKLNLKPEQLTPQKVIDVEVGFRSLYYNPDPNVEDITSMLNTLAPFGNGNSKPLFLTREVTIKGFKAIGKGAEHAKFFLEHEGIKIEAVAWGWGEVLLGKLVAGDKIDIVYEVEENIYKGNRSLQLIIEDIKYNTNSEAGN